jgi:hypothetical protein
MLNFSDEDRKLVHIIVNQCSMSQAKPKEKAMFWIEVHEHVKPLINCDRSNTVNALKQNMLGGKTE